MRSKGFKDGKRIGFHETSASLTQWKKEEGLAFLNEVSSVPLQQALRHLQTAYINFFEKRTEYPTFKKKSGKQSATYMANGFKLENGGLSLAKMGRMKVMWSRALPSVPTSVTITKTQSGKFFASFVVDAEQIKYAKSGESVGIDFGLRRLATLSNGEQIANPKYLAANLKRLAFLQKRMCRRVKGSNRRNDARIAVAKLHEKVANSRKDTLVKLANNLVKRFDTIYLEDLNIRGMTKNHCLARSVSDTSIGAAIRYIEQQAEEHGKEVIKIDRFFPSSKMCSACGFVNDAVVLGVEEWDCPKCKARHDRDDNAAKNILAVGQTVKAQGAGVRLLRRSRRKSNLRRTVKHLGVAVNA
jgi:putative transposase